MAVILRAPPFLMTWPPARAIYLRCRSASNALQNILHIVCIVFLPLAIELMRLESRGRLHAKEDARIEVAPSPAYD